MIELSLPIPPSVNALYATNKKTHRRFKSKRYSEWEKEATTALWGFKCETITGRIAVEYNFSFKDKRKRDLANFEKAISDFLQKTLIIEDDSQIDIMTLTRDEIGQNLVHITITEIE